MLLHVTQDARDLTKEQHTAFVWRFEFLYPLSQAPQLALLLAKQNQRTVAASAVAGDSHPKDQNEAQSYYQHTHENVGRDRQIFEHAGIQSCPGPWLAQRVPWRKRSYLKNWSQSSS
jgi:hypothetical protein